MKTTAKVPEILIPVKDVDMQKWATIACDQFCAKPEYWETLTREVGSAPSTLKLTCPEIYLSDGNLDAKISEVVKEMDKYIEGGVFRTHEGLVLVERQVGNKVRVGLMACIDLDKYDWHRVRVPIRATEDTIVERLPVRIKIRRDAKIELPHAIILIDNPECDIIEPIYKERGSYEKLYDFDLNMGGGHIAGYAVPKCESENTVKAFENLLDPQTQIRKYGVDAGIEFAVGDGNHSIATAKLLWEEIKENLTPEERENHPARYMLVEIVNLYGEGMVFEPIHRLIYNPTDEFVLGLEHVLAGNGKIKLISNKGERYISAPEKAGLTINAVQKYIEEYKKTHDLEVEYVHNEDDLAEAVNASNGLGIVLPAFGKDELFDYVVNVGNLPKKAFSIGEPTEKRYYLEAKYI